MFNMQSTMKDHNLKLQIAGLKFLVIIWEQTTTSYITRKAMLVGAFLCCFLMKRGKINTFFNFKVCKACKAGFEGHVKVTNLWLGSKWSKLNLKRLAVIHQLLCIPMWIQATITSTRLVSYSLGHKYFNANTPIFTTFKNVKWFFLKNIIAWAKSLLQSKYLIDNFIFKVG